MDAPQAKPIIFNKSWDPPPAAPLLDWRAILAWAASPAKCLTQRTSSNWSLTEPPKATWNIVEIAISGYEYQQISTVSLSNYHFKCCVLRFFRVGKVWKDCADKKTWWTKHAWPHICFELFSAQHNWLIYIANDYHLSIIIIPSSNCHFIDSSHNSWHIPLITSPQISPFVNVYPKILGSCGKPNPINHPQWGFIKLAIPLALRWLNIAPEEQKKSLAQPLRKKHSP